MSSISSLFFFFFFGGLMLALSLFRLELVGADCEATIVA